MNVVFEAVGWRCFGVGPVRVTVRVVPGHVYGRDRGPIRRRILLERFERRWRGGAPVFRLRGVVVVIVSDTWVIRSSGAVIQA